MEPLLTPEEVRNWIREYDNNELEDVENNIRIKSLVKAAETYVKNACGPWYRANDDLKEASKMIVLTLVDDWWNNRSFIHESPRVTMQQRQSLQGLILQIQLGRPEVWP